MKKFLLVAILGFGFISVNAQNPRSNDQDPDAGYIYPDHVGISRPLREIWAEEIINADVPSTDEMLGTEMQDRNTKREPQKFIYNVDEHGAAYGNDESMIQREDGQRPSPGTKANFAGLGNGGVFPYDPSGAAGPNHYIQAVNATTYRIYNKTTGANMGTGSVGSLWSPPTGNMGDPIIMYDRFADRWFISQFGSGNAIYIAISQTNDPTGSYYTYSYTSPQFPDYLKFSIWHDGYYMTSNQAQKVFAFERSVMLTGGTARSVYKTFSPPQGGGFFVPMPGDADGTTLPSSGPCPIFSYRDNAWGSGSDAIMIYQMTTNWTSTPSATINQASGSPIATNAFDASYNSSWNDISQPNTTQKLDGIGGIIQYRAQVRVWSGYNTVVLNWPVKISSTQRSIMWAELRQDQSSGTWSMYQQGIYTPDSYSRWVGSIAMNDQGDIALCYAKSGSSTVFPSLGYTGRKASDPLGQMTFAETIAQTGVGSQTGVNRWGDYAQTTLDPDGITFWHTGMWGGGSTGSGAGRTRIYSFVLTNPIGINEEEVNPHGLNVYPNPAENNFNITFNSESGLNYTLEVYNEIGQVIISKDISNTSGEYQYNVNLEENAAGIYTVKVSNGTTISTQKVVVNK